MIELERTFLVKIIPENLKSCRFNEIIDIYIPKTAEHPTLRLRKNGNTFELTKKEPVNDGDASHQNEQTIILTGKSYKDIEENLKRFEYCKLFLDNPVI